MSTPRPLPILGASVFAARPGEPLPDDLEPLIDLPGKRFRKIGRFVRLGLVAASRAAKSAGLDRLCAARTGVFLGSGLRNLPDLFDFSEAVHDRTGRRMPSPIQFANSVGNSAAFYIAQGFELRGPVLALSQEEVSFECALLSAAVLLEAGDIDLALVGGLDVFQPTEAEHLERMGYAPPLAVGEGSAWLVLRRPGEPGPGEGAPIGELERVEVRGGGCVAEALAQLASGGEASLWLNPRLRALGGDASGFAPFDPGFGFFATGNAAAVAEFLVGPSRGARLHALTAGRDGELGMVSVRRTLPPGP